MSWRDWLEAAQRARKVGAATGRGHGLAKLGAPGVLLGVARICEVVADATDIDGQQEEESEDDANETE